MAGYLLRVTVRVSVQEDPSIWNLEYSKINYLLVYTKI